MTRNRIITAILATWAVVATYSCNENRRVADRFAEKMTDNAKRYADSERRCLDDMRRIHHASLP
jgi:hypothetical protein